ncbi:MAG: hypothetical protein COZ12_09685 [Deltaproteobacteria bacterium CG_4_10_14_3_um_filter_60_8]|nr:MAG: hypothetical protein AUK28_11300 [Desulfobacterales bacterium CG2_30_60_27]PIY20245.1 MAG: hypothetical protein COZ12_09685 [Deltaproteobacteria bacterium CG_4_10_14_3_um_filter_60_8]
MKFADFLVEKEGGILEAWVDQVLGQYSAAAVPFFKNGKDRFANPLGHTLRQGLGDLFTAVHAGGDVQAMTVALERILLLRAVEELAPSQALAFVFGLKQAVQAQLKGVEVVDLVTAWPGFEQHVESLALLAFDLYMACRERLYQTRINELKSGRYILSDGAVCPSALMRKEMRKEQETAMALQTMSNSCTQEAR